MKFQTVNPFYVECGAYDGEFFSNSIWLERDLKWEGLLIEADPETFDKLASKNRKAWTGKFCLSNTPQAKTVSESNIKALITMKYGRILELQNSRSFFEKFK